MPSYSLKDAQDQLQKLINEVQLGQPVFIADDERVVQLILVQSASNPRKAGSAAGQIQMSDDFDTPLDDFDDYMP